MGINADEFAHKLQDFKLNAHDEGKIKLLTDDFKREFYAQQARVLDESEYEFEVEQSVQALIDAIREGKLQIRIVKDKSTHAKFYIFTSTPTISHTTGQNAYKGSLIVGSSNLSESGLRKNYEFNLESRDSDDIAYALSEFYALWQEAVPLTNEPKSSAGELERHLKEQSYLKECSVKDIYYKLLIEYFGESVIKDDTSLDSLFPSNFYKPRYQKDAIKLGLEMLKKYNGFFLSDVVGLGKTLIACIIAKKLERQNDDFRVMVVAPKALQRNWDEHFKLTQLKRTHEITSYDKLENFQAKAGDFSLVIIDESHNLASNSSQRYKSLQEFCKIKNNQNQPKKVILLSATPQKNSPEDIKNQILLFQDANSTNIDGIANLNIFFKRKIDKFNAIKKDLKIAFEKDDNALRQRSSDELKSLTAQIKSELLSKIMIRRTRTDLNAQESWSDDLASLKIKFPKINEPQDLGYDLPKNLLNLMLKTAKKLNFNSDEANEEGFGYYRYLIYPNLTEEGKKEFERQYDEKVNFKEIAFRLKTLITMLLFKRFESSLPALKSTLNNQIESIKAFIKMLKKDDIKVPKKTGNLDAFYEKILENDELNEYGEMFDDNKFVSLKSEHFQGDFKAKLQKDLDILQELLKEYESIKDDPKLDYFKGLLEGKFKGQKLVVFTEALSTARYLKDALKDYKILQVDAENRDKMAEIIKENFDENIDKKDKKNDYNIIISTDTLAEGVNLHRSHIIINYDSPWNATRLMQRIGRINRIGAKSDIDIYNFKPNKISDTILNYNAIAFVKLQSFHLTLGEDSAIYDASEEFGTQKIYEIAKENFEEKNAEWSFLSDIQALYKNDKIEFERIKELNAKSRAFISQNPTETSFFFFKQMDTNADFYYKVEPSRQNLLQEYEVFAVDFLQMAEFLKKNLKTSPFNPTNSQKQSHHNAFKQALDFHKNIFETAPQSAITANKNVKMAIKRVRDEFVLDDMKKAFICESLKEWILNHLPKDIEKAKTKEVQEKIYERCKNLAKPQNKRIYKDPQIKLSITNFSKDKK